MQNRRQILRSVLALLPLGLAGLPGPGLAQSDAFPSRPIRIVVACRCMATAR